jgi:hypothetical protein
MKAVEKYMSDIQDISHKFDFITKNGSEKQIFRLIKTLETGLSQKSEDLEKQGIFESNSNLLRKAGLMALFLVCACRAFGG